MTHKSIQKCIRQESGGAEKWSDAWREAAERCVERAETREIVAKVQDALDYFERFQKERPRLLRAISWLSSGSDNRQKIASGLDFVKSKLTASRQSLENGDLQRATKFAGDATKTIVALNSLRREIDIPVINAAETVSAFGMGVGAGFAVIFGSAAGAAAAAGAVVGAGVVGGTGLAQTSLGTLSWGAFTSMLGATAYGGATGAVLTGGAIEAAGSIAKDEKFDYTPAEQAGYASMGATIGLMQAASPFAAAGGVEFAESLQLPAKHITGFGITTDLAAWELAAVRNTPVIAVNSALAGGEAVISGDKSVSSTMASAAIITGLSSALIGVPQAKVGTINLEGRIKGRIIFSPVGTPRQFFGWQAAGRGPVKTIPYPLPPQRSATPMLIPLRPARPVSQVYSDGSVVAAPRGTLKVSSGNAPAGVIKDPSPATALLTMGFGRRGGAAEAAVAKGLPPDVVAVREKLDAIGVRNIRIAEALGVTVHQVGHWLNGRQPMPSGVRAAVLWSRSSEELLGVLREMYEKRGAYMQRRAGFWRVLHRLAGNDSSGSSGGGGLPSAISSLKRLGISLAEFSTMLGKDNSVNIMLGTPQPPEEVELVLAVAADADEAVRLLDRMVEMRGPKLVRRDGSWPMFEDLVRRPLPERKDAAEASAVDPSLNILESLLEKGITPADIAGWMGADESTVRKWIEDIRFMPDGVRLVIEVKGVKAQAARDSISQMYRMRERNVERKEMFWEVMFRLANSRLRSLPSLRDSMDRLSMTVDELTAATGVGKTPILGWRSDSRGALPPDGLELAAAMAVSKSEFLDFIKRLYGQAEEGVSGFWEDSGRRTAGYWDEFRSLLSRKEPPAAVALRDGVVLDPYRFGILPAYLARMLPVSKVTANNWFFGRDRPPVGFPILMSRADLPEDVAHLFPAMFRRDEGRRNWEMTPAGEGILAAIHDQSALAAVPRIEGRADFDALQAIESFGISDADLMQWLGIGKASAFSYRTGRNNLSHPVRAALEAASGKDEVLRWWGFLHGGAKAHGDRYWQTMREIALSPRSRYARYLDIYRALPPNLRMSVLRGGIDRIPGQSAADRAEVLNAEMERLGLSGAGLARILETTDAAVSSWRKGDTAVSGRVLVTLRRARSADEAEFLLLDLIARAAAAFEARSPRYRELIELADIVRGRGMTFRSRAVGRIFGAMHDSPLDVSLTPAIEFARSGASDAEVEAKIVDILTVRKPVIAFYRDNPANQVFFAAVDRLGIKPGEMARLLDLRPDRFNLICSGKEQVPRRLYPAVVAMREASSVDDLRARFAALPGIGRGAARTKRLVAVDEAAFVGIFRENYEGVVGMARYELNRFGLAVSHADEIASHVMNQLYRAMERGGNFSDRRAFKSWFWGTIKHTVFDRFLEVRGVTRVEARFCNQMRRLINSLKGGRDVEIGPEDLMKFDPSLTEDGAKKNLKAYHDITARMRAPVEIISEEPVE